MDEKDPGDRPDPAVPRPSRRPRDMVISLLVLLVPVVLLIGGYQIVSGRTQPEPVDPSPALHEARAAGLAATEPTGLGEGWVLVNAVFQPAEEGDTLRLGYHTPGGDSAQLVQSTVPAEQLLEQALADAGPPTGTVELAGDTWQQYDSRPGEQTLVWQESDRITLVVGTATESELHTLATAW